MFLCLHNICDFCIYHKIVFSSYIFLNCSRFYFRFPNATALSLVLFVFCAIKLYCCFYIHIYIFSLDVCPCVLDKQNPEKGRPAEIKKIK